MSARWCLLALVALACVAQAYGQLKLCTKDVMPGKPRNVRVSKNMWNASKKKAEVTISFDNPTMADTGCPTAYSIDFVPKGTNTALGSKFNAGTPTQTPVSATYFLEGGKEYTIKSAAIFAGSKKNQADVSITFKAQPPAGIAVPL